jgi:hypothetical protein
LGEVGEDVVKKDCTPVFAQYPEVSLKYHSYFIVLPTVTLRFFCIVTVCGLLEKESQELLVIATVPFANANLYQPSPEVSETVTLKVQVEPAT